MVFVSRKGRKVGGKLDYNFSLFLLSFRFRNTCLSSGIKLQEEVK